MTILSATIAIVWLAGFWVLSRDTSDTVTVTLTGALASLLATGFAAANIWPQIQAGYPRDSYWSLTLTGYTGVLTISIVGIALFFLVLAAKTRLIQRVAPNANRILAGILDCALGQLVFGVLLSLSPQAYYTLYRMLIPTLPQQSVIKSWLDVDRLKVVAEMNVGGSLSDHLSGLVFWAVIPFTIWLHLRFWYQRRLHQL